MQVMVESRMAGFGGFAGLRDGDVIVDLVGQPLPQPLDRDVFIDAIKAMRPETVVKLKVLRQGAVRVVSVKVSARPAEKAAVNALAYEGRVQELLYRRGEEAEKYWKENFAGEGFENIGEHVGARQTEDVLIHAERRDAEQTQALPQPACGKDHP